MRYLLIIILFFIPLTTFAVSGEEVRWDWVLGEPAVTDDPTNVCSDTAVARGDWVLGEPTIVFDSTATCTVPTVDGEDVRHDWVLGEPTIVFDATKTCTDTAISRFDWVLGEPTVVFDATANCIVVVAEAPDVVQSVFWFD